MTARLCFALPFVLVLLTLLPSCRHGVEAEHAWLDRDYGLRVLPAHYYPQPLEATFDSSHTRSDCIVSFEPFGYDTELHLEYTHRYAGNCIYHACDTCIWKFAEVEFPHTCLTRKPVYAKVKLHNPLNRDTDYYLRLFYQNTSYWWPVAGADSAMALENFYGASETLHVRMAPRSDTLLLLPWKIAMDPKATRPYYEWRVPAAAGNYETLLTVSQDSGSVLMQSTLNLQRINPFSMLRTNAIAEYSYVRPEHFKFVMLDEKFDGSNYLNEGRYYVAEHDKQKPLCDTCTGYFVNVADERWTADDFYTGRLQKAGFVKATYGNRRSLCNITERGIELKIPARDSTGRRTKTWGEVIFGPTFRYGHVTVRAKFAQMINRSATPNGIIHNLWLYQRDAEDPDPANPFHYLQNSEGLHRYEIDFEFWSSYRELSRWNDSLVIDYSIVDYMRDSSVAIKPGQEKKFDRYKADRHNGRQCNIISPELPRSFLDSFHTYEIIWKPQYVQFKLDGKEVALFTKQMAKIPDRQMYLWIGSPIYQDGTLYTQSFIPFLKTDKHTLIDYIRIE